METLKVGILEPEDFSENAIEMLSHYFVVEKFSGGTIQNFLSDKYAVFIRLGYCIDENILLEAKHLKYICSPTTGLNHIALSADSEIEIVSLKGEYEFLNAIRATPEHVFGLTLALLRNYKSAFISKSNRVWNRDLYKGYEICGAKIGIIGMGRIGKLIARYYTAFDASVGYYDVRNVEDNPYIRYHSIEELIDKSEIIVLEANYTDENHKMITETMLKSMKGKYFINAARGELVDEDALIECIQNDIFRGVAIDVLSNETASDELQDRLIDASEGKNVIITSHIGGATYTSMHKTEEFIAEKLISQLLKFNEVRIENGHNI